MTKLSFSLQQVFQFLEFSQFINCRVTVEVAFYSFCIGHRRARRLIVTFAIDTSNVLVCFRRGAGAGESHRFSMFLLLLLPTYLPTMLLLSLLLNYLKLNSFLLQNNNDRFKYVDIMNIDFQLVCVRYSQYANSVQGKILRIYYNIWLGTIFNQY